MATQSLSQHQFPTFGHEMADTHQGIILHSGGQLPDMRGAQTLATRNDEFKKQQELRRRHNVELAKALARAAQKVADAKAKIKVTAQPDVSLRPPTPVLRPSTKPPYVVQRRPNEVERIAEKFPELTTINDFLKYGVGYGVEASSAAGQMILAQSYQEWLRMGGSSDVNVYVSHRILPNGRAAYRALGKVGSYAGRLSKVATVLSVYSDARDYRDNKTSTVRFGYKMLGAGTGIYLGATIGEAAGPPGVLLGAGVGVSFDGLEWIYDKIIDPSFEQISEHVRYFNEAVRNGWVPGAY